MSTHLLATHVYVTLGPATAKGHDGQPYTNPDFPAGTILATDANGHIYVYTGQVIKGEHDTKRGCWPRPNAKGLIELWRDYWRHVTEPANAAPYFAAVINAPLRIIR